MRNLIEHPRLISSIRTQFSKVDLEKPRHPFFADEQEVAVLRVVYESRGWFFRPTVYVTEEQLLGAISEVERLAEWFGLKIEQRLYGH